VGKFGGGGWDGGQEGKIIEVLLDKKVFFKLYFVRYVYIRNIKKEGGGEVFAHTNL